ncbi:MAG: hypothetical protein R6V45_02540 [Oceanipulchritudo sp.]
MKKRMLTGLVFLTGILLGMGFNLLHPEKEMESIEGTALGVAGEAERGDGSTLLARIREQEREIMRLRAELALTGEGEVAEEDQEARSEEDSRPGFVRRMEERMSSRVEQLVEAYGLNETQHGQLQEAFIKQFETFRARRRGEDVPGYNLDEAVAGILTEDQFENYLEDSQEEIYNRAELMATSQLVRLNQTVQLQPGQEDLVYDAVHYTAQEMMVARQTGGDFPMRDVLEERLGDILTSEQMESYRNAGSVRGRGLGP